MTSSVTKDLMQHLTCPVTHEPLTSAVALMPCLHRVNEAAVRGKDSCPQCKGPITCFKIDDTIRALAKTVFE